MENKDIVLEALKKSEKALKNKEIAEITGLDVKDIAKAITALKKEDKVMSPKNCFYQAI